jgi:4-amino-4-deoxy-L-arabinose transferase-like glycosyltransferase
MPSMPLDSLTRLDGSGRLSNSLPWFLIAGLVILACLLSVERFFDQDEFEAVHSAWKIYAGDRIYVDFFQHHAPFLYYLLTPLIHAFGETASTLLAARMLMLGFTAGILTLVYAIANTLFNRQVAVTGILFLFATPLFMDKAIEIRPDVPQVFFGLSSLYLLLDYFDSRRMNTLLLSAFSLGIAFLFLQKIIFLAAALHALLLWRAARAQTGYLALLIFTAVFTGTWAVYWVYLLVTDQFSQYFFLNFSFNAATLDHHYHQTPLLLEHITNFNTIVIACALLGIAIRKSSLQWEITVIALGLLIAAMLYRTQYAQYYLLVLPLLAIIAARGWQFIHEHQPSVANLLLVVVFASASASYLYNILYQPNRWQLEKIAYVNNMTLPSDYVYDGNAQFNVFRKDLDYFWFGVDEGKRLDKYRMLTGYQYDIYSLIEALRPKIISDHAISDLNHPVIRDHYTVTGKYKRLYIRTEPSHDE